MRSPKSSTPVKYLLSPPGDKWKVEESVHPSGEKSFLLSCHFNYGNQHVSGMNIMAPSSMKMKVWLNDVMIYDCSEFDVMPTFSSGEAQAIVPFYNVQPVMLESSTMLALVPGDNTLRVWCNSSDILRNPSFGLAVDCEHPDPDWTELKPEKAVSWQPEIPRLYIHTSNFRIGDGSKTEARVRYESNAEVQHWNATMNARGNTTLGCEKKSYNLKLKNDASLPGFPWADEWVLYGAWYDLSAIRNPLAFHMAAAQGQPASPFVYVELWINDNYRGLYGMMQKPSPKLVNNTSSRKANGLFHCDRYEPGDDTLQMVWWDYIVKKPGKKDTAEWNKLKNAIIDFEGNIYYGARPPSFDVTSFADYILLQEATGNPDAFGLSTYFHTDTSGVVYAGPGWDFDLAFHALPDTTSWLLNKRKHMPGYWYGLFDYPPFHAVLADRLKTLRNGPWSDEALSEA
ncbi:MAG: CotH kinase family protein, partial [Flavobacteriales bacterium]|nr:CotH kinase family protein [Flavobacteriales bacterium]